MWEGMATRAPGPPFHGLSVAPCCFIPVLRSISCYAGRAGVVTLMLWPPRPQGEQQDRTQGKWAHFSEPHQPVIYWPRGYKSQGTTQEPLSPALGHCTSSFYPLAVSWVSSESQRRLVALSPSHSLRPLSGNISLHPLPAGCF